MDKDDCSFLDDSTKYLVKVYPLHFF